MRRLVAVNRKTIMVAGGLLILLSAGAVALNVRAIKQVKDDPGRQEALKQVNEAPDQLLRIVRNDDCPLKIVEARVKEVPASLFTKLTGKTTDLATVSTLPDVTLVNMSGQTISSFVLFVRDPNSHKARGIVQRELKIQPGATYMVSRNLFIAPDKITVADANGHTEQRVVQSGISSEKGWVEFAARADLYVSIGLVEFGNGDSWRIKYGGDDR